MSWKQPVLTAEFAAVGVTALLEAIRRVDPEIRFYQASSSRDLRRAARGAADRGDAAPAGDAVRRGEGVRTPDRALVPAAVRLYACSGILYNHESPRRPLDFVTRKVAHAAAAISLGLAGELWLGDLDARRDWGYAGDYVRAMALMLRQDEPDDYVIATGVLHSVQELVELAFGHVGLDWREYVHIDESLRRGARSCTTSSATPRRRGSGSGGRRRSTSRGSSGCSSTPTSSGCAVRRSPASSA